MEKREKRRRRQTVSLPWHAQHNGQHPLCANPIYLQAAWQVWWISTHTPSDQASTRYYRILPQMHTLTLISDGSGGVHPIRLERSALSYNTEALLQCYDVRFAMFWDPASVFRFLLLRKLAFVGINALMLTCYDRNFRSNSAYRSARLEYPKLRWLRLKMWEEKDPQARVGMAMSIWATTGVNNSSDAPGTHMVSWPSGYDGEFGRVRRRQRDVVV